MKQAGPCVLRDRADGESDCSKGGSVSMADLMKPAKLSPIGKQSVLLRRLTMMVHCPGCWNGCMETDRGPRSRCTKTLHQYRQTPSSQPTGTAGRLQPSLAADWIGDRKGLKEKGRPPGFGSWSVSMYRPRSPSIRPSRRTRQLSQGDCIRPFHSLTD